MTLKSWETLSCCSCIASLTPIGSETCWHLVVVWHAVFIKFAGGGALSSPCQQSTKGGSHLFQSFHQKPVGFTCTKGLKIVGKGRSRGDFLGPIVYPATSGHKYCLARGHALPLLVFSSSPKLGSVHSCASFHNRWFLPRKRTKPQVSRLPVSPLSAGVEQL